MYDTGTRIHGGANSTRKSAAPTPMIVPKTSASSDVKSVPAMNGNAPNCSFGGFHSVDQRKPQAELRDRGPRFVRQFGDHRHDEQEHAERRGGDEAAEDELKPAGTTEARCALKVWARSRLGELHAGLR